MSVANDDGNGSGSARQPTVTALIVTFNRPDKVAQTIEHVLGQTYPIEKILVIDNASTDRTPEVIGRLAGEHDVIDYRRQSENLGGAGGFSKGLRLAYSGGSDFFWVMDDDCYARPDALERLVNRWCDFVATTPYVPGFVCSLVKWHDDLCEMNIPEPVWDWPRFYDHETRNFMLVKHCSFVSVLISRAKVKEVGLPISEFFIWFDDVEYTKRLAQSYPGLYALDSVVHHDLAENKGVNFGLVTEANVWKFCYGARNQAYWHKTQGGILAWHNYFSKTLRHMRRSGVAMSLRAKIAKSMFEGLRMKVTIERVE